VNAKAFFINVSWLLKQLNDTNDTKEQEEKK